jgi:DNA helicase HerA-like ATPase
VGGRPIGQIALQGRKYGVGLLVVTQRTALVSKTILSQCNTLLTHSLINQASLNFVYTVYSSQHTRLIPNLGRFEFLAFGKALRAERPVLLKRPFDPAKKAASHALRRPLEPQQAMPPSCKTPAPRPNRPRQTALTLRSLESSSAAS